MSEQTSSPPQGWAPLCYFWDGGWIGVASSSGIVPPHSHHAVQVSLGLTGQVKFCEPGGEWIVVDGASIRPNALHSFDPMGNVVAMLFIDPETREGRWLRHAMRATVNPIGARRYEQFKPALLEFTERRPALEEAAAIVTNVARSLCDGPPPTRTMDDRVARALAWIKAQDTRGVSLEEVAREVFLSPTRFAHLFTEEMGLPFRRYLLWRKVNRALQEFGRGNNLSEAAHAAGFSDSAHLTRTFHQMFGISPSMMMGRGDFYEIPAPFEFVIPALQK